MYGRCIRCCVNGSNFLCGTILTGIVSGQCLAHSGNIGSSHILLCNILDGCPGKGLIIVLKRSLYHYSRFSQCNIFWTWQFAWQCNRGSCLPRIRWSLVVSWSGWCMSSMDACCIPKVHLGETAARKVKKKCHTIQSHSVYLAVTYFSGLLYSWIRRKIKNLLFSFNLFPLNRILKQTLRNVKDV